MLFELDADYVEAFWGLDQPPGKLSLTAMPIRAKLNPAEAYNMVPGRDPQKC